MFSRTRCVHDGARAVVGMMLFAAICVAPAQGCDLCAIYTTTEEREDQTGLRIGLAEQFTYFHTLQKDGEEVPNPAGERIASSITQVLLGYNILPRFGLQLNVPVISRDYRRVEATGINDGNVTGFGDVSLVAIGKLVSWIDLDTVAHLVAFAGVKLPSGSPAFLKEELGSKPCIPFPDPTSCGRARLPQARATRVRVPPNLNAHHNSGVPSGVHGHDLALGSGSVDGLIGGQAFASWQRAFATGFVQYTARNVGAYQYRFANDLLFGGGPGVYLATGDALFNQPYTLRVQALLSGETKGLDSINETRLTDTGMTSLYLGPYFGFGWGTHLMAELGADLPVLQNNTALQIVPDYRLRGGVTWRF